MKNTEWDDDADDEADARGAIWRAYPDNNLSETPAAAAGVTSSSTQSEQPDTFEEPSPTNHEQLTTNAKVNYHYLPTLTDEHLPDLDFYRADNIFSAKPANAWLGDAAKRPVQRALFGDFWNEGELSILFADTGKGKSILAVQIAQSIASGVAIQPMKLAALAQRVLLFDFELDERQFGLRYSAPAKRGASVRNYFKFSDNLIRARIGPVDEIPPEFRTYSEFLTASIVELIVTGFCCAARIGRRRAAFTSARPGDD